MLEESELFVGLDTSILKLLSRSMNEIKWQPSERYVPPGQETGVSLASQKTGSRVFARSFKPGMAVVFEIMRVPCRTGRVSRYLGKQLSRNMEKREIL